MSLDQETQTEALPARLPLGRRAPRGSERWYLVRCGEGREASACERVRAIVPPDALADAFVPRKERQRKVRGQWVTDVVPLFAGYFVAVSADAPALSRALAKLSFPVTLVGAVGRGYQPLSEDARELLSQTMDGAHVVRLSWGELVADELRVGAGPLVGREDRVTGWLRRKSTAFVRVGEPGRGSATLSLPLAITARR